MSRPAARGGSARILFELALQNICPLVCLCERLGVYLFGTQSISFCIIIVAKKLLSPQWEATLVHLACQVARIPRSKRSMNPAALPRAQKTQNDPMPSTLYSHNLMHSVESRGHESIGPGHHCALQPPPPSTKIANKIQPGRKHHLQCSVLRLHRCLLQDDLPSPLAIQ